MEQAICTIITKSHLHFVKALHQSIKRFIDGIQMHVLVADGCDQKLDSLPNIHFYNISTIKEAAIGKKIYDKYYHESMDRFRWSCKSVFMIYLLNNRVDKLLYLDSDLFFFSDPSFLFEELSRNHILLSPHFRTSDPAIDYHDYGRNNTHGLFNGGFIGSNKDGIPALKWWSEVCGNVCEKRTKKGYYVDQSHLNLMPILFENVGIIKNRGCNVASWNRNTCERSKIGGKLFLSGEYELVFIHFTADTIKGALNGNDPFLKPYLNTYENALKEEKPDFDSFTLKESLFQKAKKLFK